jgi:hypothetical protein
MKVQNRCKIGGRPVAAAVVAAVSSSGQRLGDALGRAILQTRQHVGDTVLAIY